MKSKLIAAKKVVDKEHRPIGLIVVESVNRGAFEEAALREKLDLAAVDCANLLTVWRIHLPAPNLAEDVGL